MAQSAGKTPDASCPMCGGSLAKTPAGQSVLNKVSQKMSQTQQRGMQAGPRIPQGAPSGAPGVSPMVQSPGQMDPRAAALRQILLQRLMQGGGR